MAQPDAGVSLPCAGLLFRCYSAPLPDRRLSACVYSHQEGRKVKKDAGWKPVVRRRGFHLERRSRHASFRLALSPRSVARGMNRQQVPPAHPAVSIGQETNPRDPVLDPSMTHWTAANPVCTPKIQICSEERQSTYKGDFKGEPAARDGIVHEHGRRPNE